MNKLAFGLGVTVIPLAVGIGAIMGLFGSTGGLLHPEVRPDHQTPPTTKLNVEITADGKLVNSANPDKANPDFASCPYCKLDLVITNKSQNSQNISVPETGASTGPIGSGETKTLDIVYNKTGTLTYKNDDGSITGHIMVVKIS